MAQVKFVFCPDDVSAETERQVLQTRGYTVTSSGPYDDVTVDQTPSGGNETAPDAKWVVIGEK